MTNQPYQQQQGTMVYPSQGWRKLFFRAPLYAWRLGLAPLLPSNFLLLTVIGRKSGLPRYTMLEYTEINGRYYLSSGWGAKAQWYQNVLANPHITLQTMDGTTIGGKGEAVTDDAELAAIFPHMSHSPIWDDYLASWGIENNVDDFVAKKERLHFLRVDPIDTIPLAPLATDLKWVWPIAGVTLLTLLFLLRPKQK